MEELKAQVKLQIQMKMKIYIVQRLSVENFPTGIIIDIKYMLFQVDFLFY